MTDPCLNCPLPDCDEDSPGCLLRQAANAANRLRAKGQHLTTDQLQAAKAWAKRNDVEFYARRSEAVQ